MIRLVAMMLMVIPVTIWGASRIAWAFLTKASDSACVCEDVQRRWSLALLKTAGVRVELENDGVIDHEAPQIVVANHVSWFDVLALAAFVPGRYAFVAKKEIGRVPLFGPSVRACGHIFIDRHDRVQAVESLNSAKKRLEEALPTVIMFPEGTRSETGDLQPFKKGAFVLAIQTGADVVPTALFGSREIMRKGSMLIRPGVIRVRFGDPIAVSEYDMEQRQPLADRAWQALSDLQSRYKNA